MEHIFAVQHEAELLKYQHFAERFQTRLNAYLEFLDKEYGLDPLPRVIVWTDRETATKRISDIPIPAYTNDYRIVFAPELHEWKDIYLQQLAGLEDTPEVSGIANYYCNMLTENNMLQILGHEFAHHIKLFADTDYDEGIWFEEGMAEYISRKFFLTDVEYEEEMKINRLLVRLHSKTYGNHSIEAFGAETYSGDYASIFFAYWRAFLAVDDAIKSSGGSVGEVFRIYRQWCGLNSPELLSSWFANKKRQP